MKGYLGKKRKNRNTSLIAAMSPLAGTTARQIGWPDQAASLRPVLLRAKVRAFSFTVMALTSRALVTIPQQSRGWLITMIFIANYARIHCATRCFCLKKALMAHESGMAGAV